MYFYNINIILILVILYLIMNNDNNVDIIKVNDNNKLLDNYQYIKPYLSDYNKNDQICVICLDNYNHKFLSILLLLKHPI